jgi:hypothetical protein
LAGISGILRGMNTAPAKNSHLHIPSDDVLRALGLVSIQHGFLEVILKRLVKQLANLTVEEADRALVHVGARAVRDLIDKFALKSFGKASAARLKLCAILQECAEIADLRNELTHDTWVDEEGETKLVALGKGKSRPLPTADEIMALARRIDEMTLRLIAARSTGFIAQALLENKAKVE